MKFHYLVKKGFDHAFWYFLVLKELTPFNYQYENNLATAFKKKILPFIRIDFFCLFPYSRKYFCTEMLKII